MFPEKQAGMADWSKKPLSFLQKIKKVKNRKKNDYYHCVISFYLEKPITMEELSSMYETASMSKGSITVEKCHRKGTMSVIVEDSAVETASKTVSELVESVFSNIKEKSLMFITLHQYKK